MRAIIPIYIELFDKLIETKSDLDFFVNSTNEFEKGLAILSGDVSTLYYGYACDEESNIFQEKRIELLNDKIFHDTHSIIALSDYIDEKSGVFVTYAGKYQIKSNIFNKFLHISGYHRQKSIIQFDLKTEIITKDLKLKHLTLSKKQRSTNSKIIVKKHSVLTLESCIVDSLSIVVEDGGMLIINDVDFKGGIEAITQKGSGIVVNNGNVRFDGVAFEYYFENLTSDTSFGIIDVKNQKSIRDFLSKSKADNIFIECDLNFAESGNITFSNDVSFVINTQKSETDTLKIHFKEAVANKNISFSQKCFIDGIIKTTDAMDNVLSLGVFTGNLDFENSKTKVSNTLFLPKDNDLSVKTEYSQIFFENCSFTGSENRLSTPIRMSFSELHFEKVRFTNVDSIVDVSKHIKAGEENSLEYDYEKSVISFNELIISDCNSVINNDGQLTAFKGSRIKLDNVKHGLHLVNCDLLIDTMIMSNSDTINVSGHSRVIIKGTDSIITNSRMPLSISNSTFAEIQNITFDSNKDMPALSVEDAIVICSDVKFRKNTTAIHIKKGGLLVNNGIKFNDNSVMIKKEHEAFNVKDYQEWLVDLDKNRLASH